jgi:hypothetical protein
MKSALLALCVAFLACWSVRTAAQDANPPEKIELAKPGPDGKVHLFNGKDLSGWFGESSVFSVQNGEIVGKSETGLKRNEFLKTKVAVKDFRLVIKMKLVPNTANSGIQFRSEVFKGHEMRGYQADAGKGWWGKLYEESARGMLVPQGGEQHVKENDWNTIEVVAVGDHVLVALNGQKTVDFKDPEGRKEGIFGLQVHSGGPTEARWKDLRLELNPKAELMTVKN